jgi:hypothetical protein
MGAILGRQNLGQKRENSQTDADDDTHSDDGHLPTKVKNPRPRALRLANSCGPKTQLRQMDPVIRHGPGISK